MKALVCEVCGGKLIMGKGGIATCDSCGIEYTAERLRETAQKNMGVVQIDQSNMIENWMKLGDDAIRAKRYEEAYKFYTKVVEVDPKNWRAVYGRGKAASWQSTTDDLHTIEMEQGLEQALDIVENSDMSKEDILKVKNEMVEGLYDLYCSISSVIGWELLDLDDYNDLDYDEDDDENYGKKNYDTEEHIKIITRSLLTYKQNVWKLECLLRKLAGCEDEKSLKNRLNIKKQIISDICSACAAESYRPIPSCAQYMFCGMSADEKKPYMEKFWAYLMEVRETEPDYLVGKSVLYPDPFEPGFHNEKEIYAYWEPKEEEYQRTKKIKTYWEDHAEEKPRYDARMKEIEDELASLRQRSDEYDKKIADISEELDQPIPEEEQLVGLKHKMTELEEQKKLLGLMEFSQRQEIGRQIRELSKEKKKIQIVIDEKIKSRQDKVSRRIDAVKNEKLPVSEKIAKLEKEKEEMLQIPLKQEEKI
jgi:tetratricopeptide (TPR) repeat protein